MEIAKNKVVTMHYRLTDDNGIELDSSSEQDPLVFLHGHGALIPGLENALVGKKKDENFNVHVKAQEAYGTHDASLRGKVPLENFSDKDQVVVGAQFHAETPDGPSVVTVVAVENDGVVVDGNHPLAGIDLNFEIRIIDIRDATAEEISHGHVHGEGGHHH